MNADLLFDYLTEQGFQPDLVEEDTEIVVCCPLCSDDRPRLYVSADSGAWHCFHCHEEGGLHRLLMQVCELDGGAAFDIERKIKGRHEEDVFESSAPVRPEAPKVDSILRLPPSFKPIQNCPPLFSKYLEGRSVSPELAAARGLGYATSGRYAYRVIIPVQSDGSLYTFIARTVLTQCPNCMERINGCTCRPYKFPKVLTPQSKDGAKPSHTLFNLDAVSKSRSSRVVVVEGPFDALRLPAEAVALMGSSASATQRTLLSGLARGRDCVLALDPDEAGYKGALKLADALASDLVPVRVAMLPEGEDVGSLSQSDLDHCLAQARPYVL